MNERVVIIRKNHIIEGWLVIRQRYAKNARPNVRMYYFLCIICKLISTAIAVIAWTITLEEKLVAATAVVTVIDLVAGGALKRIVPT